MKSLHEVSPNFELDDYKTAVLNAYKKKEGERKCLEENYNTVSQTAVVYSLSKTDATGNPVQKNIKAYNDAMKERKVIRITLKLLEFEMNNLAEFWVSKGFDIEELRNSIKTKKLQTAEKESNKDESDKIVENEDIVVGNTEDIAEVIDETESKDLDIENKEEHNDTNETNSLEQKHDEKIEMSRITVGQPKKKLLPPIQKETNE